MDHQKLFEVVKALLPDTEFSVDVEMWGTQEGGSTTTWQIYVDKTGALFNGPTAEEALAAFRKVHCPQPEPAELAKTIDVKVKTLVADLQEVGASEAMILAPVLALSFGLDQEICENLIFLGSRETETDAYSTWLIGAANGKSAQTIMLELAPRDPVQPEEAKKEVESEPVEA